MSDFYQKHIVGTTLPDLDEALTGTGFQASRSPVKLTYTGLQVIPGEPGPGAVAAIDPRGPTAGTDVRVGDSIIGYSPSQGGHGIMVPGEMPHSFGLTSFRQGPGLEKSYLDVRRGKADHQVHFVPSLIDGGHRTIYRASFHAVAGFFR